MFFSKLLIEATSTFSVLIIYSKFEYFHNKKQQKKQTWLASQRLNEAAHHVTLT
jgi:hypothetical protein